MAISTAKLCPECKSYMQDWDTHPDWTKRILRCPTCGFCKPKIEKPAKDD